MLKHYIIKFNKILSTIKILGYPVYAKSIDSSNLAKKRAVINTINPHCYIIAKRDRFYSQALHQSDILLPDGVGIIWAIKTLNGQKIKRISGSDLHIDLLQQLQQKGGKVFYLGSSFETLNKIQARVRIEYSNIIIGGYSPPFKAIFSNEDNYAILKAIEDFHPDVLFVGMTAPKQEKWVFQHKEEIDASIIASIGAVFDFYAGTVKRPGKFWISLGMEWFPRLIREPKRLWRRTLISTPVFIWDVLLAKFKQSTKFRNSH